MTAIENNLAERVDVTVQLTCQRGGKQLISTVTLNGRALGVEAA